jgi:hypothetical protein
VPRTKPGQDDDATTGESGSPSARPGKSAGRVTPKGGATSTSRQQPSSGRYTPPIPKDQRHSPGWFPYVLLTLMVVGLLVIVLNYTSVMPGGTNNWYLIGGIGGIIGGLIMATFYH